MSRSLSAREGEPSPSILPAGWRRPGGEGAGSAGSTSVPPTARAALLCRLAREIASAVLGVAVEEIARPNRSVMGTCRARHLSIYLAHVIFQVPLGTIAIHFGRDRTSVAHAVRRIEDARDEDGFDDLVTRLERLATAVLEAFDGGAGS